MTTSKLDVLTLDEVCENVLRISAQTGRNRLSRGLPMPPSFRVGRRRLFLVTDVDQWLQQTAHLTEVSNAPGEFNAASAVPRAKHHRHF
jgi:Helix-turn-helix domain